MIEVNMRYSVTDLLGVTAKVVDMPHHYVELHPEIRKHFWDPQHWPKHILVRYTWKEQSEIDVASGFFVLFGSGDLTQLNKIYGCCSLSSHLTIVSSLVHNLSHTGLALSFILVIYVLQSSRDKLERFVRDTVAESSMPGGGVGVAKVE